MCSTTVCLLRLCQSTLRVSLAPAMLWISRFLLRWRVSVLGSKDWERDHLSELAQHYIAGLGTLLVHAYCSYKRFDRDAIPAYATWGRKNRSAMVRIPTHKPGSVFLTRCWAAYPWSTIITYLANAVTLMAGQGWPLASWRVCRRKSCRLWREAPN